MLAQVAELDEDTLIDLCDTAVTAAVLTEADVAGRYTFAHALIEHALYDDLSAGRRARAHRAVAEALEELDGDDPGERIGELAYHWAHATQPQDGAEAVAYAQRAGDRALGQLAPDEALRWYRDALDLLDRVAVDDPRRRAELLLGLGDAQRQTGYRARLLALLCAERIYDADFDERLSLATDAVDMARPTGDKAALVDAIRLSHDAISMPQTLELRRGWNSEACDLADDLGDPTARLHANMARSLTALAAADLATTRTAFAIFEAESERIGQPFNRWHLTYQRALMLILEGDLDAAEQTLTEALTLGTAAGQPDAVTIYGVQLIDVRWKQGRLEEMVPLIEQATHDNPGLPGYRAALVFAKSYDDPHGEVTRLLNTELTNDFPMSADFTWLTTHLLWADAAAKSGHQTAAAALYQRLLPWHDQIATRHITVAGSAAHYLGLLAHTLDRHDEADQWFTEALALHERMEAPFFVAWTQAAWAALLADRNQPGDTQRPRAMVDTGLPVSVERGYGYIERDARTLLERIE